MRKNRWLHVEGEAVCAAAVNAGIHIFDVDFQLFI